MTVDSYYRGYSGKRQQKSAVASNGVQFVEKVQIRDRRGRRPRRPGGKTLRFLMVFGEFATFAWGPSGTPAPTNRFIDSLSAVASNGVFCGERLCPFRCISVRGANAWANPHILSNSPKTAAYFGAFCGTVITVPYLA